MGGEGLPKGDRSYPVTGRKLDLALTRKASTGSTSKRSGRSSQPSSSDMEMDLEEIWRRYMKPLNRQNDIWGDSNGSA